MELDEGGMVRATDTTELPVPSAGPVELSASFLAIATILSSIVVCTFVGNLFVIVAILIDKNLQTPANQLVLSLAVADLMVACLVMPLGTYNDIHQGWLLGKEVCEFWTSADVLCCTASILNLLAIALDRYWAVTNVDYIYKRTRRRVSLMIVCAWTVGAVVSLAPIFGWKDPDFARRVLEDHKCLVSQDVAYQIFATISTFYAPLVLLLALYWRIFKVARKRIRCKPGRKQQQQQQQPATNLMTKAGAISGAVRPTQLQANLQQQPLVTREQKAVPNVAGVSAESPGDQLAASKRNGQASVSLVVVGNSISVAAAESSGLDAEAGSQDDKSTTASGQSGRLICGERAAAARLRSNNCVPAGLRREDQDDEQRRRFDDDKAAVPTTTTTTTTTTTKLEKTRPKEKQIYLRHDEVYCSSLSGRSRVAKCRSVPLELAAEEGDHFLPLGQGEIRDQDTRRRINLDHQDDGDGDDDDDDNKTNELAKEELKGELAKGKDKRLDAVHKVAGCAAAQTGQTSAGTSMVATPSCEFRSNFEVVCPAKLSTLDQRDPRKEHRLKSNIYNNNNNNNNDPGQIEQGPHHQQVNKQSAGASSSSQPIKLHSSLVQLDAQLLLASHSSTNCAHSTTTNFNNNNDNLSPPNTNSSEVSECQCCCCTLAMPTIDDEADSATTDSTASSQEGEGQEEDDHEYHHKRQRASLASSGGSLSLYHHHHYHHHHHHHHHHHSQNRSGGCLRGQHNNNNNNQSQYLARQPIASRAGYHQTCKSLSGQLASWRSDRDLEQQPKGFDSEKPARQTSVLLTTQRRPLLKDQGFREAEPSSKEPQHQRSQLPLMAALISSSHSSDLSAGQQSTSSSSRSMLAAAAAAELDDGPAELIEQLKLERELLKSNHATANKSADATITTIEDGESESEAEAEAGARLRRLPAELIASHLHERASHNKDDGNSASLATAVGAPPIHSSGNSSNNGERPPPPPPQQPAQGIDAEASRQLSSIALSMTTTTANSGNNNSNRKEAMELAIPKRPPVGNSTTTANSTSALDIRGRFKALGQLVSFVQTSRQFNSSSSAPTSQSSDDESEEEEEEDDDDDDDEEELRSGSVSSLSVSSRRRRQRAISLGSLLAYCTSDEVQAADLASERPREGGEHQNQNTPPRTKANQRGQASKLNTPMACEANQDKSNAASETNSSNAISRSGQLANHNSAKLTNLLAAGGLLSPPARQAAAMTSKLMVTARLPAVGGLRSADSANSASTQQRRQNMEIKREKKAAKTLAIITGVFVCCWLPFFLNAIVMPVCGPACTPSDLILSVLLWLGYLNSLLNPIIYTIFSPDFRRAFHRLLCWSDASASASGPSQRGLGHGAAAKRGRRSRKASNSAHNRQQQARPVRLDRLA